MIRIASDVNGCLHAKTGQIGHFQAQFTPIALAEDRRGADKKTELQASS